MTTKYINSSVQYVSWYHIRSDIFLRTVTFDLPPTSRMGGNQFVQRKKVKIDVYKAKEERLQRIVGGKMSGFHQHPWQVQNWVDTWESGVIAGGYNETGGRSRRWGEVSGRTPLWWIPHCSWLGSLCCSLLSCKCGYFYTTTKIFFDNLIRQVCSCRNSMNFWVDISRFNKGLVSFWVKNVSETFLIDISKKVHMSTYPCFAHSAVHFASIRTFREWKRF